MFDVNLRPTLWRNIVEAKVAIDGLAAQADLVKLSLDDARGLFGTEVSAERAIDHMLALGARDVVLTDGERGCWFASRQNSSPTFVPAFLIDAIEPTGAGDAFTAALICRLFDSNWSSPVADDVRFAAAAGALATTQPGAWQGLPSRDALTAFLETR